MTEQNEVEKVKAVEKAQDLTDKAIVKIEAAKLLIKEQHYYGILAGLKAVRWILKRADKK